MRKLQITIVFFLCQLLLSQSLLLAKNDYIFRTFSPEGGFYYDGVKDILQDKEGFIWVLMDENLYRFDGYKYKSYYSYFTSSNHFIRWTLKTQTIDSSGSLFINTSNGLFQYDGDKDSFKLLTQHKIDQVKIDAQDRVWVYYQGVWSILDLETLEIFTPLYEEDSARALRSLFCLYQEDLYVFTWSHKMLRYNNSTREFNLCFQLPVGDVSCALINKGKLWALSASQGLLKIDLATSLVEASFDIPTTFGSKSLLMDKNDLIWLGTIKGLYVINPTTRAYRHYLHSETDPFSLPNSSIWSIREDNRQNIWIGTFAGGLAYVNLDEKMPFKSYLPPESGLSHAPVSAFAESSEHIWISTEGGGLNCMDKLTEEFTYYTHDPRNLNSLSSNNVKSLTLDKYNRLWISTFNGGMDCLDLASKKFKNYRNNPENENSLLSNSIRKVTLEADTGLWIVYQHNKEIISYYSFEKESFTHFDFGEQGNQYYVFDILRGGNDKLWVLSYRRLYVMDLADLSVRSVLPNDSLYLYGRSLSQDASSNIWIGTTGNGLIKYNPELKEYTFVRETLNWGINTIYSLSYSDDGDIWMGTDKGLYCYSTMRNDMLRWDKKEGTQGQVYYPLASMKGKDGKLYFGGTQGFTVIKPGQITRNTHKPKVIFSEFFIDHKPMHPHYSTVDSESAIVLNHDQINFGFQFSSDNYHIPEKNRFKYRLNGYDNRWYETKAANRTAMYSKMPAGTYYFEVLAANNDGIWSCVPRVIKVVRKPAPWLSFPAYILYFLILAGIFFLIYRHYKDKEKLEMQLYLESIEKDKQEHIHQAKLRFFTNISHDFRTPLSLIIAALDKLRRDGLKEYYYRILNGNAQRLLKLVNELMDFRSVENGKMRLELQAIAINSFIEKVAADFGDYAMQRHIAFTVNCQDNLPKVVYADGSILEKVVMNLLNNAFKYTSEHGTITIETGAANNLFVSQHTSNFMVGEKPDYTSTYFVRISDTGAGIAHEAIGSVFDRFYKADTENAHAHLGTGIGLALVKSLVLLHKGSIAIYSEVNKGTDIIVYLPLDRTLFDEADFIAKEETEMQQQLNMQATGTQASKLEGLEENITAGSTKRVLIAEDNHDLRALIAESLSDEFEIVQAADGNEATAIIDKMDIDLIISDIMMPHKDGLVLCNEVKVDRNTSHIPFVLLTAKVGVESKIEGVGSGADMYFEKPIDLNYLKLSIQNIFKHQQQIKDYYAKNFYADSSELASNEQDSKFLRQLVECIEENLDQSEMDVNLIARRLCMSKSKLYSKMKSLTGKSIVEFVLNYRLRKAAKFIIEQDSTMREVMVQVGIESQPYFTTAFKKMFGQTPTAFAGQYKKRK
ncbi:hybrid sensor histidine kinase/response regulator [Bacteroidales bacterium]|nr:hybrid sensor histidine kinase/response regulator [Bacteroidales bacterium]